MHRDLHAHPELARAETRTTTLVARRLDAAGIRVRPLPGTGLVADLGPQDAAYRVALRADLDALPVLDRSGLPWASVHDGICHACGHDVHIAALLGAGLALRAHEDAWRDLGIAVRLIFQPAEEVIPGGAHEVVAHGGIDGVDRIFAVHCDPGVDVGHIGLRRGPHHRRRRLGHRHAVRPRRAHLPAAPDRGPHLRPGQGGHRRAGRPVPPARPAGRRRAGVGQRARRRRPERHPLHRHRQRDAADARRRGLGRMGHLVEDLVEASSRRTACREGRAHPRGPAGRQRRPSRSSCRDAAARRCSARTAVQPTRQSLGGEDFAWYLRSCPAPWSGWAPVPRGPHLRPAPGRPDGG